MALDNQERFSRFVSIEIIERAAKSYFDESAVEYEAARLAQHQVVFVLYRGTVIHAVCIKGAQELQRYLRGEIAFLSDIASVYAHSKAAAFALRDRMRAQRKPQLRVVK
jgi:hypothetical protein